MANKYWVGGGSSTNWSAITPTNWSLTDGGGNDAAIPATGDDVFLKSSANCVLNVTTPVLRSFDMTGYSGTFTFGAYSLKVGPATENTVTCTFAGTIDLDPSAEIRFSPAGTAIINFVSGGFAFKLMYLQGGTGSVDQQDALNVENIYVYDGNWNTNGFAINAAYRIIVTKSSYSPTLNITDSTITVSGSENNSWDLSNVDATLISTNSTINITSGATFKGGGKTYNVVTFSGNAATITGNNTFVTLNVNTAGLATGLKFTIDSIQTITNFTTNGSVGNLAKILSTSASSHFHLTTGSAQISVDYMSIKDSVADQANTWYAGANSVNVSGNSGWVFTAPKVLGVSSPAKVSGVALPVKILGVG